MKKQLLVLAGLIVVVSLMLAVFPPANQVVPGSFSGPVVTTTPYFYEDGTVWSVEVLSEPNAWTDIVPSISYLREERMEDGSGVIRGRIFYWDREQAMGFQCPKGWNTEPVRLLYPESEGVTESFYGAVLDSFGEYDMQYKTEYVGGSPASKTDYSSMNLEGNRVAIMRPIEDNATFIAMACDGQFMWKVFRNGEKLPKSGLPNNYILPDRSLTTVLMNTPGNIIHIEEVQFYGCDQPYRNAWDQEIPENYYERRINVPIDYWMFDLGTFLQFSNGVLDIDGLGNAVGAWTGYLEDNKALVFTTDTNWQVTVAHCALFPAAGVMMRWAHK